MEWSILFVGPVGAGKTQLIRTISDIEVLATEETPTDGTAAWKASTTVAMDVGAMSLGGADHVRLYGAPGQMRFRFMWDVLLEQAKAVVVLVDHSRPDSCADLVEHLRALRQRMGGERRPVVVAVTHADLAPERPIEIYEPVWRSIWPSCPPVFEVDARNPDHVRILLLTVAALLEMRARLPAHHVV
jgi:signal recognition particle receptor subunit beta